MNDAEERQAAIYRAMDPVERLRQAMRLRAQMLSLMDAALRAQHPDWSAAERQHVIAERVRNARTG